MNYEPIIGLEVHIELNTKSKMFCKCSADYFGKEPNTHTCPVCLGLPGTLPYINEEAIESCMKIGLTLNCSINEVTRFERKNYFYPDLPKSYQISQYKWPLCVTGKLKIESKQNLRSGDLGRWIRINRVHQEEDTGKLSHIGSETLIDFNRSGVPLVEIVTEPDFRDSAEVRDFAKKLQLLFRSLGVSNADMERGDMRLEANVSVRKLPITNNQLPNYRIELKNINSFRFMVAAIEYEIKRQAEALERGEKLVQETRGWNEDKKETYLQRSKEEAHDYRYFPDPDLPELRVKSQESRIKEEIKGKLPQERVEQLVNNFGISMASGATLMTQGMADYFEKIARIGQQEGVDAQETANYIINRKIYPSVSPEQVIFDIKARTTGVIKDEVELKRLVQEVIKENPESVIVYKAGKLGALNVLLGAVMKKTSGKADMNKVKEILLLEISTH